MPVTYKDYYAVLGLLRPAFDDEIPKAFLKKARELPPDVTRQPGAEARYKARNYAYVFLYGPANRQ